MEVIRNIQLRQIKDASEFNKACMGCRHDVTLHQGRYIVDGKSAMGLWALDLSSVIEMHVSEDDAETERFLADITAYLAD